MRARHRLIPSVAIWCAIDAATTANGCLWVARAVPSNSEIHRPTTADEYTALHQRRAFAQGGEVALQVGAGAAVLMSPFLPHRSEGNRTSEWRRAFMPQFSAQPIMEDDGKPVGLAVPLSGSTE